VNVGSTFSGVGGFDLGFERAGMSVVWQAEIDEWCRRVLRGHWPDGWTAVDGDKTPDGRRYAACGNGVVANVSEWIGRRIMAIEEEL